MVRECRAQQVEALVKERTEAGTWVKQEVAGLRAKYPKGREVGGKIKESVSCTWAASCRCFVHTCSTISIMIVASVCHLHAYLPNIFHVFI